MGAQSIQSSTVCVHPTTHQPLGGYMHSLSALVHFSSWPCGVGADEVDEAASVSVRREVQVNWFEPARLRCRPQHVLRIAGVKPLDSRRSPVAETAAGKCEALRALETQLNSSCQGRHNCVIDFGAVNAIRTSCRHVRFINVDVYCEPRTTVFVIVCR